MRERLEKRDGESLVDFKERLYKNRVMYGLKWEDISEILDRDQSNDHVRKTSYGYLECIEDIKSSNKFDKSVLFLNDIHAPFERKDVLEIISKHADEITTLVLGGDIMDCYAISSFPKLNRGSIVDELIYTYEFVKQIRKILNNGQKIVMYNGNHEERMKSIISKMNEKELQQFLNPNILDMIVEGFTIHKDNKKIKYDGIKDIIYIPHWYVVVDKIVCCHPKDFSRVKGTMLEKVTNHFINKDIDFEVVVFGHTHKYSSGIVDRYTGKIAVENPCMCQPHEYSDCGKLGYSPQTYGYTIIKYNDNEKVSFNNVKTYILDEVEDLTSTYKIKL